MSKHVFFSFFVDVRKTFFRISCSAAFSKKKEVFAGLGCRFPLIGIEILTYLSLIFTNYFTNISLCHCILLKFQSTDLSWFQNVWQVCFFVCKVNSKVNKQNKTAKSVDKTAIITSEPSVDDSSKLTEFKTMKMIFPLLIHLKIK